MFSRITKAIAEYKEIKYLAYHDSLTGLLNRNWLYKNINNIECNFIYFIDINDLHKINLKGHTYGDEHIKFCVNLLNPSENCILCRYAGDEFLLFSNHDNFIRTNKYFSVGKQVRSKESLMVDINEADNKMLGEKEKFKKINK